MGTDAAVPHAARMVFSAVATAAVVGAAALLARFFPAKNGFRIAAGVIAGAYGQTVERVGRHSDHTARSQHRRRHLDCKLGIAA